MVSTVNGLTAKKNELCGNLRAPMPSETAGQAPGISARSPCRAVAD